MSRLFYHKEAKNWNEALPIGNGRLGAMVFGNVEKEHLQLNEETIWYGKSVNRINPDAKKNLNKVRELILDGKIPEAEKLMRHAFSGIPQSMRPYQSLGDCFIQMEEESALCAQSTPIEEYERALLINQAVGKVKYKKADISYERTYFVSEPSQVIVIDLSASEKKKISFDLLLTRERFYDEVKLEEEDTIFLKGNLGKDGLDFCLGCRVFAEGGSVKRVGEHLIVRGADRARVMLSAASTYRVLNPQKYVKDVLKQAVIKSFGELLEEHIKDYQKFYDRVSIQFTEDLEKENMPTDARLKAVKNGDTDIGLAKLYFDYGRYLLISSSRPGTLPANLQGIWNDKMSPDWDSKYTININTEMNYWPVEACNLSELHQPLFDMLRNIMENGQQTAQKMYGCRGFVAHHNVDIWADTAPQDIYIPATYWVMGGAWLCTHLWMHYEYTQDKIWLREVYDILEQAVLFFEDFLIKRDGEYLICPSVSPENTYIMHNGIQGRACASSSMDNQILKELFRAYLQAAKVLERQNEITKKAEEILISLPKDKIGKYGQIMEWREDYDEAEPGHRHISQLYALHPGTQITVDSTPELAKAARKTIERRLANGGGHTGWSCAWLINFYARLRDGENAWNMFLKLLRNSTSDNMLDNHPRKDTVVFQIDGNLGGCAALVEMLIQSSTERIILLPACPKVLEKGSVHGIKVGGNALFDFSWEKQKVTKCSITAYCDWKRQVFWNGKNANIILKQGEYIELE